MKKKPFLVVLTGAGISAESGVKTFRDAGGLWEGHDVMEVASPQGWHKNPKLVLDFYNQRRRQLATVQPNAAHHFLKEMENYFEVHVITQNVDDLHERAGSSKILHLHGQLTQVRSTHNINDIRNIGYKDLNWGDTCEKGYQLRPNIVWFGEMVPAMESAALIAENADIMLVIGTSLVVYPAASLLHYTRPHIPKYLINPNTDDFSHLKGITMIAETATTGVEQLRPLLMQHLNGGSI